MLLLTPLLILLHSSIATCLALPRANNHVPYYTLEEHWVSPALQTFLQQNPVIGALSLGQRAALLPEIGPQRLASMDANNIRIQTVSHVPAPPALYLPNLTALANDQLAARIAAHPDRFRGFCILPMGVPAAAAAELRRCVRALGFVGALVDAHLPDDDGGQTYDGPAYDELWAAAVELDVPIYLHPTTPAAGDVFNTGRGLYAPAVAGEYSAYEAVSLGTWAWGWHERTGLSFIKMYLGGVFDRFPGLRVVLGHMGEMVPFFLARTDQKLSVNRSLSFREVYDSNVYVTTSGMFSLGPMTTVLRTTDSKRVMYSVDWPFEYNENGTDFMSALRSSGLVSEEEFEDIAFRNAKRLLRI